MDAGLNRALTLAVFSQGSLPTKILEGHRQNDDSMAGPRKIRLGFMGHMNLIAEETVKLLERYPRDVAEAVSESVPQPGWDDFVRDVLKENREREAAPLAGGRPMAMSQFGNSFGEGTSGQTGDNEAFASYLSSQMNSGGNASDDDDDSDDDGQHHSWLAGQHHAGGGSGGGFEDVFEPERGVRAATGDDDEEWASAGRTGGEGDGFGDFQSSANQPLTSADWAANAFDDDDQSGHGEGTTPPESPTSSTEDDTPFVDLADASTYRTAAAGTGGHRRSSSSSESGGLAQFRQQVSGEVATGAAAATPRRRGSSVSSGSGSTDPSAAQAVDADEPLGPGVASDAEVKDGMIQRTLEDGTVVSVPLDDVAMAASAEESGKEGGEGGEQQQ